MVKMVVRTHTLLSPAIAMIVQILLAAILLLLLWFLLTDADTPSEPEVPVAESQPSATLPPQREEMPSSARKQPSL
jgi:hypothetical protein